MNQKLPAGTYLCKNTGYYRWIDSNGYYHRWVYKQEAKKRNLPPLRNGQIVHHKNGNKLDNRLENLRVVNFAEHFKIHYGEEIKSDAKSELLLQIWPVLDAVDTERDNRDFNAGSIGVTLTGLVMLLVGLFIPLTWPIWYTGIMLIVIGISYFVIGIYYWNFFNSVISLPFKKKRKQ